MSRLPVLILGGAELGVVLPPPPTRFSPPGASFSFALLEEPKSLGPPPLSGVLAKGAPPIVQGAEFGTPRPLPGIPGIGLEVALVTCWGSSFQKCDKKTVQPLASSS